VVGNGTLPRAPRGSASGPSGRVTSSAIAVVNPSYHTLPTRRTQRNRELGSTSSSSSAKKPASRSRRRSSDRQHEMSRHKIIMNR
jgi:hypothetical protein